MIPNIIYQGYLALAYMRSMSPIWVPGKKAVQMGQDIQDWTK